MKPLKIRTVKLSHACDELPSYQTPGASGMDLLAALSYQPSTCSDTIRIRSGDTAIIPTGIMLAIPRGYEAQVRSRSGLAFRHEVFVLNSPGTIDADYRGEIKVCLKNLGMHDVTIHRGDRIAQIVFVPVTQATLVAVESLDETERGEGGFGSTGA